MTRAEFISAIQKSQCGNKQAFGRIYDEYFGKLYITALDIVKKEDLAYDVASEVMLKLLEFKRDVTQILDHNGYMFAMVRNEAKNLIKKRKHEISVDEIIYGETYPMSEMLWVEDIFRVLTDDERELFIVHIVWNMPLKDATNSLDITYKMVKERFKTVKTKIKSIYK